MAYFSNGSEGMDYQERFCMKCRNWRYRENLGGMGCPVWDAHLCFAYEECNSKSNAKGMLDMLIPMVDTTLGYKTAGECAMFLAKSAEELEADRAQRAEISNHNLGYAVMPAMAAWARQRGIIP